MFVSSHLEHLKTRWLLHDLGSLKCYYKRSSQMGTNRSSLSITRRLGRPHYGYSLRKHRSRTNLDYTIERFCHKQDHETPTLDTFDTSTLSSAVYNAVSWSYPFLKYNTRWRKRINHYKRQSQSALFRNTPAASTDLGRALNLQSHRLGNMRL